MFTGRRLLSRTYPRNGPITLPAKLPGASIRYRASWVSAALVSLAIAAAGAGAASGAEPYRYDFGGAGTPPAQGYVRVTIEDKYSDQKGYGFVHSPAGPRGFRTRGIHKDTRLDTLVYDQGGLAFVRDLPNGDYLVSLASGDAQYDGNAAIQLNGQEVGGLRATGDGGFVVLTAYRVRVGNGRLKVQIGGDYGRLNYLDILPLSEAEALGVEGSDDARKTLTVTVPSPVPVAEFSLDRDAFGPLVRVNLDRIQNWTAVPGIERHWPVREDDEKTQPAHAIVSNIRDVDGNGRLDVFRQIIEVPYSQVARFAEDGRLVWKTERLAPAAGDETGMHMVDINGDGRYEVVISQTGMLYCISADTGEIRWQVKTGEGGTGGPGDWDYPMVIGHFTDRRKKGAVVRAGLDLLCYDHNGRLAWKQVLEGHIYGHAMARYDVTGDGYHEIFVARNGSTQAFTHDGKLLWEDKSQRNHSDNFAFGDIDGDGRIDVAYDRDGCGRRGPLVIADAVTGKQKFTIDYRKDGVRHNQGFTCDNFRPDLPGLEIVVTDKASPLLLYDSRGRLLWRRDTPTSLVSRADWNGDGAPDILSFAIGVNLDPTMSVWNGRGERLYAISLLPSRRRSYFGGCAPGHGFDGFGDLSGNGRADVLMASGPWRTGPPQHLFLMAAPGEETGWEDGR